MCRFQGLHAPHEWLHLFLSDHVWFFPPLTVVTLFNSSRKWFKAFDLLEPGVVGLDALQEGLICEPHIFQPTSEGVFEHLDTDY